MEVLIWPLLLLVVGLLLVVAEVMLPSGGLLGLVAGSCLIGSSYVAYLGSAPLGARWILLETALVPATWIGAIYGLPRTRIGRRVYLQPPTAADIHEAGSQATHRERVGRSGRVLTPLRPSGMIELDGRRVEAIAESGLIDPGVWVRVVAVRSGRVVVRVG